MRLVKRRYSVGTSQGEIVCDSATGVEAALASIRHHRKCLEDYVLKNPVFMYALSPVQVEGDAPLVVKKMAEYASIAGVGPMASVAGVLADLAVEDALKAGARAIAVENGGEVALAGRAKFVVGVKVGGRVLFALKIMPEDMPIGIATSSGKYGHALSFGEADSVTVIAETAGLADAAATAICNATKGKDAIEKGLARAKEIRGVRGVIIVLDGLAGMWGNVPEMVNVQQQEFASDALGG